MFRLHPYIFGNVIFGQPLRDTGYRVEFEHHGGLRDKGRPGDIIVFNWEHDKHLLIDVAVTNPLCPSRAHLLEDYGSGGAAEDYETHKKKRYRDLDRSIYMFVPFVIETCGGIGNAAMAFCVELTERWKKKTVQK